MKCKYHSDREAVAVLRVVKGVVEVGTIPECYECAELDYAAGMLPEPIPKLESRFNLEFRFRPHFCNACIFTVCCWGEVSLTFGDSILHELLFPIRRGSTFHSWQLVTHMERLTQMYMSTTRGLKA